MSDPIKNRENNARRKLARRGYLLRKSRTGGFITVNGVPSRLADDDGGYMILDAKTHFVEAGEGFTLALYQVEDFIDAE